MLTDRPAYGYMRSLNRIFYTDCKENYSLDTDRYEQLLFALIGDTLIYEGHDSGGGSWLAT